MALAPTSWVLVGLAGAGLALVIVLRGAGRRVDLGVLVLLAFAAPWNGWRPVGPATATDLALALLLVLLVVGVVVGSAPRPVWSGPMTLVASGSLLLLIGGTIAEVALGLSGTVGSLARLATGPIGIVAAMALAAPGSQWIRRASLAFGSGAAVSAVAGLLGRSNDVVDRAFGLAVDPNHFGLTVFLGSVVSVGVALDRDASVLSRGAAFIASFVCVAGVLSSGSRAALVGILTAAALLLVHLLARRPGVVLASVLGCAVLLPILVSRLGEQNALGRLVGVGGAAESAQLSDLSRDELARITWAGIDANPWIGQGFSVATQGHNLLLQGASVAGVLGLAAMVLVHVGVLVSAWRALRPGAGSSWVTASLAAASAAFLVFGLAQNMLFDRYVWVVLALALVSSATATAQRRSLDG